MGINKIIALKLFASGTIIPKYATVATGVTVNNCEKITMVKACF